MVGLEARDLVLGLLSTSTIGVGPQVVAPPLKTAGLLGRLATLAVSSTTRDSGFLLRLELLDLIGIAALSRVKDLGAFAAIGLLGPCRADSNSDGHQRGHHSAEASQAAALGSAGRSGCRAHHFGTSMQLCGRSQALPACGEKHRNEIAQSSATQRKPNSTRRVAGGSAWRVWLVLKWAPSNSKLPPRLTMPSLSGSAVPFG